MQNNHNQPITIEKPEREIIERLIARFKATDKAVPSQAGQSAKIADGSSLKTSGLYNVSSASTS